MTAVTGQTGHFISLEGSEGAGKSTSMAHIIAWLKTQNIDFIQTREPGGTEFAEEIRELLLAQREEPVHSKTELLLMYAARAQHVGELIKPNLEAGRWVVSDRFNDASFAYQGAGRGLSHQEIAKLDEWTLGDFKPNLTLFLDLPVDIGMQRATQRGELDRFERENIEFFERVREGYLKRAEADPERIKIIDASKSIPEVQEQISRCLETYLESVSEASAG